MVQEKKARTDKEGLPGADSVKENGVNGNDVEMTPVAPSKETVKTDKSDDLSEEDKKLKEDLELCVERVCELTNPALQLAALDQMRTLIRTSTTSRTSVPKPLKFLRPHYARIKKFHAEVMPRDNKVWKFCAEIISVAGMMMNTCRDSLHYRLVDLDATTTEVLADWGPDYITHLAMELEQEWNELAGTVPTDELAAATTAEEAASPRADAAGEAAAAEAAEKKEAAAEDAKDKDKDKDKEKEKEKEKGKSRDPKEAERVAREAEQQRLMELHYDQAVGPPPKNMTHDQTSERKKQLLQLAEKLVPFLMAHNAEADAVDLLSTLEHLELLPLHVDASAYPRVCLYLSSCVPFVPDPDNLVFLRCAIEIYRKFDQEAQALRCALQLNDMHLIKEIFYGCSDQSTQKQLAFLLARQQVFINLDNCKEDAEELDLVARANKGVVEPPLGERGPRRELVPLARIIADDHAHLNDLKDILYNAQLSRNFLALAKELDIMEPKSPDDIYKTHLEPVRPATLGGGQLDSAKQNLASSLVNGLVNCGFGRDRLLDVGAEATATGADGAGMKWIAKNKEHGVMSTVGSLGWIMLWDVDGGLTLLDKYLYADSEYVKAGALLACGVLSSTVRNDCEPALGLLGERVKGIAHDTNLTRLAAVIGLGVAYAGSNSQGVYEVLCDGFSETANMEMIGLTALSLGLVAVGSGNSEAATTIVQQIMNCSSDLEMRDTYSKFLALGLALIYLGKQDECEVTLCLLDTVAEPMRTMAKTLVEVCAYAGTGNVLKIQRLLQLVYNSVEELNSPASSASSSSAGSSGSAAGAAAAGAGAAAAGAGASSSAAEKNKKADEENKKKREEFLNLQQGLAVIGVSMLAVSEEIGSEMANRLFGHMLRFGDVSMRRAVPLSLALNSISNPKLTVLETLNKYAHDNDVEVACNAILSMGLVGAGTNNSRLASMLRQLAVFHAKEPSALFMVRLAQGLTHLGKGTLTLSPFHSERGLLNNAALGGLLAVLLAALDVKTLLLGRAHYLLYYLTPAIKPRMLVTLDEKLNSKPVSVRVGQAVDVVAQAGRPKTITGFQTHTTPVLLAYGERAELGTEEFIPLSPVMEGFVILKKNADYKE